jgi:hypothetical protein
VTFRTLWITKNLTLSTSCSSLLCLQSRNCRDANIDLGATFGASSASRTHTPALSHTPSTPAAHVGNLPLQVPAKKHNSPAPAAPSSGHGEESGEARRRRKAKNGAAAARDLLCRSAVELAARRGSKVVAATSDGNAREELAAGGLLAMGAELAAGDVGMEQGEVDLLWRFAGARIGRRTGSAGHGEAAGDLQGGSAMGRNSLLKKNLAPWSKEQRKPRPRGEKGTPWEAPSRGKKGLGCHGWGLGGHGRCLLPRSGRKKGRPALARWEEGEDTMGGEGAPCALPEKRGTLLQPWGGEGCACGRGGRREWRLWG